MPIIRNAGKYGPDRLGPAKDDVADTGAPGSCAMRVAVDSSDAPTFELVLTIDRVRLD